MNKKFVILIELIKNINILNLTLILTIVLSSFKINKYIIFIIVMLITLMMTNITQKIIIRYLGNNRLIFQSKSFSVFVIFLNILFLAYCYFFKEYGMIILLIIFFICHFIWKKSQVD